MIGFDTETYRTTRSCLVPKVVCLTLASTTDEIPNLCGDHRVFQTDMGWQAIVVGEGIAPTWGTLLREQHRLVAHRAPYDLAVLADTYVGAYNDPPPDVYAKHFSALDAGRILDTNVRERLLAIADGSFQRVQGGFFSLAQMTKRYLGIDITENKKDPDRWQINYHKLDGVPLDAWPEEAISYAIDDALYAEMICYHQAGDKTDLSSGIQYVRDGRIIDEVQQTKASWALHLMACHGFNINAERAAATLLDWRARVDVGSKGMQRLGLMRGDGRKVMVAFEAEVEEAVLASGLPLERTPGGKVSTKSEILQALDESRFPELHAWGVADEYARHLSKYDGLLQWGPGAPITSNPNGLVATGRCSWSNPPYHQPPGKGGFREAHEAPEGYAYVSLDYDQIELCALAWILNEEGFGSEMLDAINSGIDLHCAMGANILNAMVRSGSAPRPCDLDDTLGDAWTYELVVGAAKKHLFEALAPFAKMARKLAKVANFGLPGGMGAKGFVAYAKGWGLVVSLEEAQLLIEVYLATWPAMQTYFDTVKELTGGFGSSFTAVQYVSGRLRGGCGYTDGCNTFFQGFVADGIKEAAWRVAREQLCDAASPAYGSRTILLLHDELLVQVPLAHLHEASYRIRDIMKTTMEEYMPGIRIGIEPAAMRFWSKAAETVHDEQGRLALWEG